MGERPSNFRHSHLTSKNTNYLSSNFTRSTSLLNKSY
uniref:Uncharacterized protein n=1 Tax=Lepeophtheirus salmonis TaxID=72036 RepID=A0A0K2TB33_LEPSM